MSATPSGSRFLLPAGAPNLVRASRRTLLIVVGIGLAVWLAVIFGQGLARVSALTGQVAERRSEIGTLEARVQALHDEIALIETEPFLRIQARAYGVGEPGERSFARRSDAPPPARIVPLGGEPEAQPAAGPFEEWLRLLFG